MGSAKAMRTLDFCRKFVRFDKSSPITGNFDDSKYPFLRKPMAAADDISCKRLVIFKASSAMGTVLGQCINLKRIVCDVGDQKMVCQSDDDAATWSKTRGKEWIRANADAMRLLSRDKYAITNDLVLWRHKFLEISGPSIAAAQSLQVRYLQTDESHLEHFPDGRLIEFEKRMGGRWDRQATHITTAPDEGREVAGFYLSGQQDEWHFRCPECAKLFWPLWDEDAKTLYGQKVFFEVIGTGRMNCVCPHCSKVLDDTARDRYALNRDGDYVAQNPTAAPETRSFRWSVFAMHSISWREMLIESQAAMEAAKLGNLKPWEDFEKKRLCKIYVPRLPDFGDAKGNRDYKLGDSWGLTDLIRFLTCDPQAGKAGEPAHRHALVTEWDRQGNSRRICYRKIDTAAQLHEMALEFGVSEGVKRTATTPGKWPCVMVDSGHEPRRTFRECSDFRWIAFKGSDLQQFHETIQGTGMDAIKITSPMPYSDPEPQSGIIGEAKPHAMRYVKRGGLPKGWAYCITGTNPELYGYLYALITGSSGRYFGIASDFDSLFPKEGDLKDGYSANMPAFMPVLEPDKKTGTTKKVIWKKIRADHIWDLEIMSLVLAIRHGFFPLSKISETETQTTLCQQT